MKLTGKLKENVEKTGSVEEAKKLIAEAGLDLSDEEVENVTGGVYRGRHTSDVTGETPPSQPLV